MIETRWRALLRVMPPQRKKVPRGLFISRNDKTGMSINVAIAKTCRPTAACASYCYGLGGRIRMTASLRRHAENAQRFDYLQDAPREEVTREAHWIAQEVLAEQDFLRFFGVGDLQQGSIRVINELGIVAPDLRLWVTSRKPVYAMAIRPVPSVNLMLSVDYSTKPEDLRDMRAIVRKWARAQKGRAFLAWTQVAADDVPLPDVEVVFALHRGSQRAPWTTYTSEPRTCPATVRGGAPHESACTRCRFCIDLSPRRSPDGSSASASPIDPRQLVRQGRAPAVRGR